MEQSTGYYIKSPQQRDDHYQQQTNLFCYVGASYSKYFAVIWKVVAYNLYSIHFIIKEFSQTAKNSKNCRSLQ